METSKTAGWFHLRLGWLARESFFEPGSCGWNFPNL